MKNRRIIIAAFLCLAVLITGVGYAALTAHILVDGTGSYNMNAAQEGLELDLVFVEDSAKVIQSGTAASTSVVDTVAIVKDENNKTSAKFEVNTLATLQDEAIFQYTLKNNNEADVDLTIEPLHTTGKPNPSYSDGNFFYFTEVTVYASEEDAVAGTNGVNLLDDSASYELEAGASAVIRVNVKLTSVPSANTSKPESLWLHISATHQ